MNKLQEKLLSIKIHQFKDHKSFELLYDQMVDPLYRFIYLKVNSKEIAQDLISELFLKAWKDLTNRKEPVKYLKSYLYTVARNLVIDYYRSAQKQRELALDESIEIPVESSETEVIVKLEGEQIITVIQTLKDSYKEVLILKHVQELSLSEIARIIEKTPVATRVLLHRANQALKREYEKVTRTT